MGTCTRKRERAIDLVGDGAERKPIWKTRDGPHERIALGVRGAERNGGTVALEAGLWSWDCEFRGQVVWGKNHAIADLGGLAGHDVGQRGREVVADVA